MFLWPSVRSLKPLKLGFFKEFNVGNFDKIHVGNRVFINTESNIGCLTFQTVCFPVLISGLTHKKFIAAQKYFEQTLQKKWNIECSSHNFVDGEVFELFKRK